MTDVFPSAARSLRMSLREGKILSIYDDQHFIDAENHQKSCEFCKQHLNLLKDYENER